MNNLLATLITLLFTAASQATQCETVPDQQMFDESKFVFTAKVVSASDKAVQLLVVKSYKGNAKEVKSLIPKPGYEQDFKDMRGLQKGPVYLFSSRSELDSNSGNLMVEDCNWMYEEKYMKKSLDWLETKTAPIKEKKKKSALKETKKK